MGDFDSFVTSIVSESSDGDSKSIGMVDSESLLFFLVKLRSTIRDVFDSAVTSTAVASG
jgi:hypothetical protein